MTPNMAAIFGAELSDAPQLAIVSLPTHEPLRDALDETVGQLLSGHIAAAPTSHPIIEGTEHFSIYVDEPMGEWPEFIPGYHYDIRQPSRLRGLCSPVAKPKAADADADALAAFNAELQAAVDQVDWQQPF